MLQFSRRDDLQNTGFDPVIEIVESFGPVFLKLREARWKETFHTITNFTGAQKMEDLRNPKILSQKYFK